jgi:hypothetical protein
MTDLARNLTVQGLAPHGLRPVIDGDTIYMDEGGQIAVHLRVAETRLTEKGAIVRVVATINAPGVSPVTTDIPAVADNAAKALQASLNHWNSSALATVLAATGAMPAGKVGVAKFTLRTGDDADAMDEASIAWEVFAGPVQVTTTGGKEVAQEFMKQEGGSPLIRLMLHALTAAHRDDHRYHVLQVNVARRPQEGVKGTLKLNGADWPHGRQALEAMEWPDHAGVLGLRQFLIIKRV